MAEENKPRRPVAGSRPAASRPRRIAGRTGRDHAEERPDERVDEQTDQPAEQQTNQPADEPATRTTNAGPGPLSSRSATKVLVGAAAALALLLVAEALVFGWSRWIHEDRTDEVRDFDQPFEVGEAPVQIPLADWRAANKAAADAVTEILTVDWKNYDQNLRDAAGLMTDDFLEEYRNTARDTRDKFVEGKTDYKIEVVGSSVVEATEDQVAALLFLNQTVNRGEGKDRAVPQVYQVRAKVRMVRTESGWMLDQLQPF